MNGIYLYWFQKPKNIQENFFHKIRSSIVSEYKVPKYVHSILRTQASVEVENDLIVWMLCLRWSGIVFMMPTSSAQLKFS